MAKLIINEENKKSRIEPEIYGHFSEHLGRCIYEGIYVGEKSEIPNVNGMRTDVVDALKFRYCAGRVAALRTNITGWTESDRRKSVKK